MGAEALSLEDVPDVIAADERGKAEALRLVANIAPCRAAAVLSLTAEQINRWPMLDGRSPLDYLRLRVSGFSVQVGPFGGHYGAPVAAALFLDERRDRFAAWLEARGIDPAPCCRWVDERVGLFRVAQVIVDSHHPTNTLEVGR